MTADDRGADDGPGGEAGPPGGEAGPPGDAGVIGGLGEIAFRVEDLDRMGEFYERVVGLEPMRRGDDFAFFRVAEGYRGHTQVLALFDRTATDGYRGIEPAHTTVDHVAFAIDGTDFAAEVERLEGLGLDVATTYHEWVEWRSLYVDDPEGNRVEFVCHDPDAGRG